MSGTYKDFIPAGEDVGAQGNGYSDFVPPHEPVKKELTREEQIRLARIENLAKARAARGKK